MFFLHGDLADKKHSIVSASKKTPTKKEQKGAFAKKKKFDVKIFFLACESTLKIFKKRSYPLCTHKTTHLSAILRYKKTLALSLSLNNDAF